MAGFEILEHTADVGVRAVGTTLEETFEQAARGVVDIAGIGADRGEDRLPIELQAHDRGALLVDFLSEILWLHDSRDALVFEVEVEEVTDQQLRAAVTLSPRGEQGATGTQVKAITYHRLRVERRGEDWVAEVYVDV